MSRLASFGKLDSIFREPEQPKFASVNHHLGMNTVRMHEAFFSDTPNQMIQFVLEQFIRKDHCSHMLSGNVVTPRWDFGASHMLKDFVDLTRIAPWFRQRLTVGSWWNNR